MSDMTLEQLREPLSELECVELLYAVSKVISGTGTSMLRRIFYERSMLKSKVAELENIVKTHDLCHDLHGKVGVEEFAGACEDEQRKLYGSAPTFDSLKKLEEEYSKLASDRNRLAHKLLDIRSLCLEFRLNKEAVLKILDETHMNDEESIKKEIRDLAAFLHGEEGSQRVICCEPSCFNQCHHGYTYCSHCLYGVPERADMKYVEAKKMISELQRRLSKLTNDK